MATQHRIQKRAQKVIGAVVCPQCGAGIGQPCTDIKSDLPVHSDRRDAWRKWKSVTAGWGPYTPAKAGDKIVFQIPTASLPEDMGRFSGEIIRRLDANEFLVRRDDDGERFTVKQLSPIEFVGARGRIF